MNIQEHATNEIPTSTNQLSELNPKTNIKLEEQHPTHIQTIVPPTTHLATHSY
jgi:hypothetical protein